MASVVSCWVTGDLGFNHCQSEHLYATTLVVHPFPTDSRYKRSRSGNMDETVTQVLRIVGDKLTIWKRTEHRAQAHQAFNYMNAFKIDFTHKWSVVGASAHGHSDRHQEEQVNHIPVTSHHRLWPGEAWSPSSMSPCYGENLDWEKHRNGYRRKRSTSLIMTWIGRHEHTKQYNKTYIHGHREMRVPLLLQPMKTTRPIIFHDHIYITKNFHRSPKYSNDYHLSQHGDHWNMRPRNTSFTANWLQGGRLLAYLYVKLVLHIYE